MSVPLAGRVLAGLFVIPMLVASLASGAAAQPADPGPVEPVNLAQPPVVEPPVERAEPPVSELGRGRASWYGPRFHGRRTSNGERFDMNELTAAHKTLRFGTRVRVRNVDNGREVLVRINDRGPHVRHRIIDLSKAAAAALGFLHAGEASVVLIAH